MSKPVTEDELELALNQAGEGLGRILPSLVEGLINKDFKGISHQLLELSYQAPTMASSFLQGLAHGIDERES
jgi:hypothetical protein